MDDGVRPLLRCRGVSKHFGALAAVKDLSFDVAPGEVLGIGGPNGAGKTTLFDVISGLDPADGGDILFDGVSIARTPPQSLCHRGIARTFQLDAGFDTLTVAENALVSAHFGRRNRGWPGLALDREARRRAAAALEAVGLAPAAGEVVRNLPVFHRKLLMMASALATDARLLLLDEPVGGLNPAEIDRMTAIVEGVRADGVTIVVIEHVMRFLVRLSDRVLIMHHGEKIYEGSPRGLAGDRRVIEVYLGESAARRLARAMDAGAPREAGPRDG